MRIGRLLEHGEIPPVSRITIFTLLAVVMASGLCSDAFARAQSGPDEQVSVSNDGSSQSLSGPYQKWLDQDVRWIIAPEERAEYMKLSSNKERLEFIQSFWQRRNPASGAIKNKFKEEHYRRIAYTNVHFAANAPGWMTDRGRIYIEYGRPESIEDYPVGSVDTFKKPYEVWHYRRLQEDGMPTAEPGNPGYKAATVTVKDVDIKFVDVCSCGDYRLLSSKSFP